MNRRLIRTILILECLVVGGVVTHYNSTNATPKVITESRDFISDFELADYLVESRDYKLEQIRLEQERIERERQEAEERRRQEELAELERLKSQPHFNPYNVSELSNLSKEQISIMLEGTALHTLVNAFYWYEQQYQVNAVFLMALTAEESGWGRSYLAINNNNLSGHKNSSGGWAYYNNWGECLEESFRLISHEYVNPNGAYYTGPNMYDINLVYCPDPENPNSWANNISQIGYELMNKLNGGK